MAVGKSSFKHTKICCSPQGPCPCQDSSHSASISLNITQAARKSPGQAHYCSSPNSKNLLFWETTKSRLSFWAGAAGNNQCCTLVRHPKWMSASQQQRSPFTAACRSGRQFCSQHPRKRKGLVLKSNKTPPQPQTHLKDVDALGSSTNILDMPSDNLHIHSFLPKHSCKNTGGSRTPLHLLHLHQHPACP